MCGEEKPENIKLLTLIAVPGKPVNREKKQSYKTDDVKKTGSLRS